AAGTVVGALLLAGLDQKTFAILITAMVVLFLARGDRIVGDPGARRAQLLTPVVGFVGGVMQGTTSISSPVIGSFFHAMKLPPREYVITLAAVFQLSSAVQATADQGGEGSDDEPVEAKPPSGGGVGGMDACFRREAGSTSRAQRYGPDTERDRHPEEVAESDEGRRRRDRWSDAKLWKEVSKRQAPARN